MQHPAHFPPPAGLPHSAVLRTLAQRGYLHQCTNLSGLDAAFEQAPVPVYSGFDATADSLHVGHLLPLMALRRLQQAGHKPIILIGGGTTRIGDPSFRSEARPMLSEAQIATNIAGLSRVFARFLTIGSGPTDALLVDNAAWLDSLSYLGMLREVGGHFSVNRMLSFDSVRSRLERQEGLSLLEFNYMVLQAYDFLELARRTSCRVQIGGSDQWGNIVGGVDLVRRMTGQEVFGLTVPLLTTASGSKMGKTAAGAVWLNAEKLAPYDYWQFWRNTEDADVVRFLRLFTDLSLEQIAVYETLQGAQLNPAKQWLADHATQLAHGAAAAEAAAHTAALAFGAGLAATGLPVLQLTPAEWQAGLPVLDLLVRSGLAASRNEARRLLAGRGVRLDGATVTAEDTRLAARNCTDLQAVRLSAGRKRHVLVQLAGSAVPHKLL